MGNALLINPVNGDRYLLDKSVVLGCDSSCSIPFADWDLAPVHASINKVGEEWHLSDLGAPNGVYLDYKRLPAMGTVRIPEGSSIRMGNTELFFTQDAAEIQRYEQQLLQQRMPVIPEPVQPPQPEPAPVIPTTVQTAAPVAPVMEPVRPPERKKQSGKTRPKKKNGKLIAALVSVAAVVVLLFGWCGIFHLQGNSRMRAGDYPAAMSSYQKDFLFGHGAYREAARLSGEQAYAQKDYVTAADYFQRAGDQSQGRWSDSIYERGKQLIAEGRPEEAIDVLQQIGTESRAVEQIDRAKLAIAQDLLNQGDYQGAIDMAMTMQNLDKEYPVDLLDACYHGLAEEALVQGEYAEALAQYQNCRQDPAAQANGEALAALLDGDLAGGARLALTALEEGRTDLSREQWQGILDGVSGYTAPTRLEERVAWEAARALLEEVPDFGSEEYLDALKDAAYLSKGVGSYEGGRDTRCTVSSYVDLKNSCGADPQGKILVVGIRRDYPDKNESCAILFDVMRLLPKERIPASLDEVEYLVVISYDYSRYGSYSKGTAALVESARITVTRLPGEQQLYAVGAQGNYAPQVISYYGSPPAWESGGAPAISQELYQALKKAAEMP